MSITSLPRNADTRCPTRRAAALERPITAVLAVLSMCLVATLVVRGSERVDSGWTVATPSTVLHRDQPADPSLRIAINHILEQSQLPLLRAPARRVESNDAAPDADQSAEEFSADDGWRPAGPASDSSHEVMPDSNAAPIFRAPSSAASPTTSAPPADKRQATTRETVPMELGPMIRAAGKATPRPASESESAGADPSSSSALAVDADSAEEEASPAAESEEPEVDASESTSSSDAEPPAEPLPPLTRSMRNLRTKVRRVLKAYYNRPLNSRDNDPWEMMHGMLAYGVHSRVRSGGPRGELITSVGWLCFNRPCKGLSLLYVTPEGELRGKQGVGLQGHMGQFLAMLAQCQVSTEYPIRAGGQEFTIQDLIEAEKETCYPKTELTFKLIALMHYLDSDATWVNDQGLSWDIPRLIREELVQPIRGAACGGTHRLAGLSLAARTRVRRGEPLDGEYLRAAQFVEKYHDYAFQLQNRDGSLSTEWFRGRGDESDVDRRIKTTGHILEWLIYSLDDQEVRYTRTVQAVNYLANLLSSNYNRDWEVGPMCHAIHALKLYDERVFQPYDSQEDDIASGKAGRSTSRVPSRSSHR